MLERIFECFLSKFADAEGNWCGQFFTQRNIFRVLVEMIGYINVESMTNVVVQVICLHKQSTLLRNMAEIKKTFHFFGQESNQTIRTLCKTYNIVHIFTYSSSLFTSKPLLINIFCTWQWIHFAHFMKCRFLRWVL